ncbi:MAG: type IV pilus twitching motility protein PilT [Pseudomonadota bacterium]
MPTTLTELLSKAVSQNASDLHISTGLPPQIRVDGSLRPLHDKPLSAEETQAICYECLDQEQVMKFEAEKSIDLSFGIEETARFRGNIYWSMGTVAGSFRAIPYEIPTPAELGLPDVALGITNKPRGLVLVTGPTGSGKSTTIASLIERINLSRNDHIITIEDPIEYVFTQKKCVINQREIGHDTLSFQRALKYVLRQDPDVVLIGEMRDLETIQSAITIAETGHLVFATLHTNTAVQTIDRIIDVFTPHQQAQIRTQLSFILEGVFCQQLIPKKGGGRVLAMEILLPHSGIRNTIREGKTHQIGAQMEMGQRETSMITMDQSLAKLVHEGKVEVGEAARRSVNMQDFEAGVR